MIHIWGGEPTLNPNSIIYILETFKKTKSIEYIIFTNGVFLHNKLKTYISSYENKDNLYFQISYDGKELTSKNRKHKKEISVSCTEHGKNKRM